MAEVDLETIRFAGLISMSKLITPMIHRLESVGLRKRARGHFTMDVAGDVVGWLGINTATRHQPAGHVEVNPVVGIRNQGVERIVAELRGDRFHPYIPPTVSTPIGYLMAEHRYRAWFLGGVDSEAQADDLTDAVAAIGIPFMESGASLAELCGYLDQGLGFPHQLIYRRPVAWMLAGDRGRAMEIIDAALAARAGSTADAAQEFRAFAQRFRGRYGLSRMT